MESGNIKIGERVVVSKKFNKNKSLIMGVMSEGERGVIITLSKQETTDLMVALRDALAREASSRES